MSAKVQRLKSRFWERVPLSLTLALLGVHVGSVAAVIYVAQGGWREQTRQHIGRTAGQSFERFAGSISDIRPSQTRELQDALQAFNESRLWAHLRVVSAEGLIVASIAEAEIRTHHWQADHLRQQWPTGLTTEWGETGSEWLNQVTFRTPFGAADGKFEWLLEGVTSTSRLMPSMATVDRLTIGIVLASSILLLLTARLMYRHFRPLVSIGSNLVRHSLTLHQELSSLRLASEQTAVAKAWNQLIKLCEELREVARQASAYQELSSALQNSASGAFLEAAHVAPEGIMHIVDCERLGYANMMACRLLGVRTPVDDPQIRPAQVILWDLEVSELGGKILETIRSARSGDHFESRTVTLEGEVDSAYRVRVMPLKRGKNTDEALVRVADISQQARADKARDEFVSQVAHELRTPLTNIQAYTETYGEFDDPQIRTECFNVINKETRRLARLIEEMLSRSQMDLGSMDVRRDDVELLGLLKEAVRDLRASAEGKSIELIEQLPAKLPTLCADRDKLAVVFNNLLGNAIKYTESGGTVSLRCYADEGRVQIHVSDTGIGVAEQEHNSIFERMYRSKDQGVQRQNGTGIGLTTAREIAQAHGGDIRVASELGKGSTFTVDLPITGVPAAAGAHSGADTDSG